MAFNGERSPRGAQNPQCPVCGGSLIAGRCLACETRKWSRFVQREIFVLVLLVGITVAAFFVTRAVARSNDSLRRRQAAAWFSEARRASESGLADAAVGALRHAVSKDPANRQYRLALAEALAAARLEKEAKRALLALRGLQPEDPQVNLQLARLEASGADAEAARRYYQSAVSGLWRTDQAGERQRVRFELIEFLLAHHERARALSELLLLVPGLPASPDLHARAGRMFLAAGNPRLALERFAQAIRLEPDHSPAVAGAGEAAFELGDYARALMYFNRTSQDDPRLQDLRAVARYVVTMDPLAPRLGARERRRRLVLALDHASARLQGCAASAADAPPLSDLLVTARELRASIDAPRSRADLDLLEHGLELAFRIERAISDRCPNGLDPLDRALLLIGRRHGFEEQ